MLKRISLVLAAIVLGVGSFAAGWWTRGRFTPAPLPPPAQSENQPALPSQKGTIVEYDGRKLVLDLAKTGRKTFTDLETVEVWQASGSAQPAKAGWNIVKPGLGVTLAWDNKSLTPAAILIEQK